VAVGHWECACVLMSSGGDLRRGVLVVSQSVECCGLVRKGRKQISCGGRRSAYILALARDNSQLIITRWTKWCLNYSNRRWFLIGDWAQVSSCLCDSSLQRSCVRRKLCPTTSNRVITRLLQSGDAADGQAWLLCARC
jgi:hypothetical protein